MTTNRTRSRFVALAAVASFAFAGFACDRGGDDDTPDVAVTEEGAGQDEQPTPDPTEPLERGEDRLGRPRHDIELVDNAYRPSEIVGPPNEVITLLLENTGDNGHTFTAPEFDLDVELQFGQESRIDIPLPASGEFTFYCRFHRDEGMEGTIVVAE